MLPLVELIVLLSLVALLLNSPVVGALGGPELPGEAFCLTTVLPVESPPWVVGSKYLRSMLGFGEGLSRTPEWLDDNWRAGGRVGCGGVGEARSEEPLEPCACDSATLLAADSSSGCEDDSAFLSVLFLILEPAGRPRDPLLFLRAPLRINVRPLLIEPDCDTGVLWPLSTEESAETVDNVDSKLSRSDRSG